MSPETPLVESEGQIIEKTSSTPVILDTHDEAVTASQMSQEEYQAKMEQALAEFQAALRTTVHTLGAKKYDFQVGNCEVLMGTGVQGVLNDGTFLTIPWHAIQRIVSIDTRPLEDRNANLVP